MAEQRVKVGKQVDESQVDQSKATQGKKPEQAQDVEGQAPYLDWVICPCCFTVNEIVADTDYYLWFRCWDCGCWFEA